MTNRWSPSGKTTIVSIQIEFRSNLSFYFLKYPVYISSSMTSHHQMSRNIEVTRDMGWGSCDRRNAGQISELHCNPLILTRATLKFREIMRWGIVYLVSINSACRLPLIITDHLCILVIILPLSAVAKKYSIATTAKLRSLKWLIPKYSSTAYVVIYKLIT